WYHEHMLAHFNRSELFEELPVPTPEVLRRESVVLQTMLSTYILFNKVIYEIIEDVFDPKAVQLPQAYGLIKLHKEPHKLRIIKPVVNWINSKAAKYVARALQPYVDSLPHVLGNSLELARDFTDLMSRSHCIMSYDVCDMYNSISQHDALQGVSKLAIKEGWWDTSSYSQNIKWNKLLVLCRWVFSTSYVGYGGKAYKQKKGLPMGSPLSPVLANLYMAYLESEVLSSSFAENIIYVRYLDDILLMSTNVDIAYDDWESQMDYHPHIDDMQSVIELISICSLDSIQFEHTGTASHPGEYVEFLDLKIGFDVYKRDHKKSRPWHRLWLKVYDKPTNLHIYTDPGTFYPIHYVYNWIQGENIRLIRNSSTEQAY